MTAYLDKIETDPRALATRLGAADRPLVFTNGCFDLLHRGHVEYLYEAAALGRTLVVALNTDTSVTRLGKAAGRPVVALADRMAVVAGLGCVDWVTCFDEDTPAALIECLRPEVLVKGADWAPEQIVGADAVRGWGGSVHSLTLRPGYSTSELIRRIRALP